MIRVRFSPAPTGSLHIGSARTALFNWLYARHHDGVFVLRIEDTDVARSREEWVVGIQDTLRWLGIDWDEGPILQSSRFPVYLAAADRLLAQGDAYECYCTEEEVRERNDAAVAAGRAPGYDGRCRALDPDERVALAGEGRPRTIRFRTPDVGVSSFTDLIRGEVRVDWSLIHDFVIVRSDGAPIFFLANAVDDLEMGITQVIRGEDLIDSTHRVLALRAALGATDVPEYAHLPLIVDAESRAKLSKRHGAVALEDFRHDGYLPEALMNYIALLGWAPADDGDEVLDADGAGRGIRPRPRDARRRRLRPGEARLAERRVDPSPPARRARRASRTAGPRPLRRRVRRCGRRCGGRDRAGARGDPGADRRPDGIPVRRRG